MEKFLAAAMIVAAATIIAPSFAQADIVSVPESFEDDFDSNWTENGQLTNMSAENGYIIADQGSSGTYLSDIQEKRDILRMNNVRVEANLDSQDTVSQIEVWTLRDGTEVESRTFQLQDGEHYYDLQGMNETYNSYRYELTVGENSEIHRVRVSGIQDRAEGLSQNLGTIAFFVLVAIALISILPSGRKW